MPNNINALPSSGPLSLQAIADALYLYRSYSDGSRVAIDSYYGDILKTYNTATLPLQSTVAPSTPPLPTSITKRINFDPFHGKRFAFPILLVASSNNYNVFDNAATYAQNQYGYSLTNPNIPFIVIVTNNSNITSSSLSTPAMLIGVGSDGVSTFNQHTTVQLINNGNIVGKADTTPIRSYSGGGGFYVTEGQTTVSYTLQGGGGGGGAGGRNDSYYSTGGNGGNGGVTSGSIAVKQGDRIDFGGGGGGSGGTYEGGGSNGGNAVVNLNGVQYTAAPGGGGGGGTTRSGPNTRAGTGTSFGGGGPGGPGGGNDDGHWGTGAGWDGGSGGAWISYQPNIPGGTAIQLSATTTITNNGVIAGGTSSSGVVGGGRAIQGSGYLTGPIGGTVYGAQVK